MASNYDDHLRNHLFLTIAPGRWSLSPAYDLNPVPEIERAALPKTPIIEHQAEPSIEVAMDSASRFGLRAKEAKSILGEITSVVQDWRALGRRLHLKSASSDAY